MQETVTTAPERKSLLSSFLDVLEAQNKAATAERQLQEERYRRRAQRIYDYHGRCTILHQRTSSNVISGARSINSSKIFTYSLSL